MKNKSAVILTLGLMLGLAGAAHAASGVRGAKPSVTIYGVTGPIGVSSAAAVLYGVTIGTGAVTDFVVLFDSGSSNGITNTSQTSATGFKMRLYASSATQNTVFSFDPPLQFRNGIIAANATGVMSSMITYEAGRITQGY